MSRKRDLKTLSGLDGKEQIVSEHPSGAKAPDHFAADSARLKSCPDATGIEEVSAERHAVANKFELTAASVGAGCGSGCTCSTANGDPAAEAPMTLASVRPELVCAQGQRD